MYGASELLHGALVLAFAVIGAVGVPGVLLVFTQMMMGEGVFRPRR